MYNKIKGANYVTHEAFCLDKEEKLEVVCNIKLVKKVITALREVHPYEEPAIDIIPLLDETFE